MLKSEDGVEVVGREGLCNIAQDYFHNLFMHSTSTIAPVIDVVHAHVSSNDNSMFLRDF